MQLEEVQKKLKHAEVDGWLIYDLHGLNPLAKKLLNIDTLKLLTRRLFYWVPVTGQPIWIVHEMEREAIENQPGNKAGYYSWKELNFLLQKILGKAKKIAMEYSPFAAVPSVSFVDAGTFEMIRKIGVEIVSSADLIQFFTSVLNQEQIGSHLASMEVVHATIQKAWKMIANSLDEITEYDVQQFILQEFEKNNCITSCSPICAVNEHASHPHYTPTKARSKIIKHDDLILIDLWCKKNDAQAVYADITQVAIAGAEFNQSKEAIFDIVLSAQKKAISFLEEKLYAGVEIQGKEVDICCRDFIARRGYGAAFSHRTGHNIDSNLHGAGVNFDSIETDDGRAVLPGMCFSIEPGIYLPDFGIRLETNVLIDHDRKLQITGGLQEEIIYLLK